jgi:iron-sulfur cluster assembly protein
MSIATTAESIISLTEPAANEIRSMLSKDPEAAVKGLRVFIEKGGCSGLQYGMVFDQQRADDLASNCFGVQIFVDPVSVDYLRGAVVDFSDALTEGGFKIRNPKARESCGCGKSFQA